MEDTVKITINHNINNTRDDIVELIEMQHNFLNSDFKYLHIHFSGCKFMNGAVAVIIGTLPIYAKEYGKSVKYKFDNDKHPILEFMRQIGMYKFYMKKSIGYTGENAVPFDRITDENKMDEYTNRIMNLAPIDMTDEAKDILSSYFYEIYQNSLFHANSIIDVFSSGFWLPKKQEFSFSIYDMGVGITYNIRKHSGSSLTSEECLDLAFEEGYTTLPEISRGLGLYRLERFIRLNKGTMSMYTNDIYCIIKPEVDKRIYGCLNPPIQGTLIIINITADREHKYIVK